MRTPHPIVAKPRLLTLSLAACMSVAPAALLGCDKDETVNKSTTTKTTQTPDGGVKKTTETTEKKVEVEHKNP